MNREEWLNKVIDRMRDIFGSRGYIIPMKIKISCGFPYNKKKAIGQCWSRKCSKDGYTEIFISPFLERMDEILPVVVHELIHAAIGVEFKHGPEFKDAMHCLGLTGRSTTCTPGEDFFEIFDLKDLPPYPHSGLTQEDVDPKEEKDSCRQLKAVCPGCGYVIRVSKKWASIGLPTCPCGQVIELTIPLEEPISEDQSLEEEVIDA